MKKILITVFVLLTTCKIVSCQVYLDSAFREINKAKAVYYKLTEKVKNDKFVQKYYLMNDTLIYYNNLKSVNPDVKDGKCFKYYPSGKLEYINEYSNNQLHGKVTGYYENGKIKRTDIFDRDTLVSGKCFNKEGNDTIYRFYQKPPKFHGKMLAVSDFPQYIEKRLIYPHEATDRGLQGKVIIQFEINTRGQLDHFKVLASPDRLLTEAAIAALHTSDLWEPAIYEEKISNYRVIFPVVFRKFRDN